VLGRDFAVAVNGVDVTIRLARAEMSPNWPLVVAPAFTDAYRTAPHR